MKTRMKILVGIGCCAAAISGLSLYLASFTVHGKRQTLDEALNWQRSHYDLSWFDEIKTETYTVNSYDGYVLHAALLRNPDAGDNYIILSHGYTDTRYGALKYCRMYLDLGYNCIIYDLRGHGENEPAFCTYSVRESKDLKAVIDDTRKRFGNVHIGLHGESLGSATTIACLKYDQTVDFAVADCGFADIENVLKGAISGTMHLPSFFVDLASVASKLRYGYAFSQMKPVDGLDVNKVPVLFIHGANDTFIPPSNSKRMQEATGGYSELYLIQGAEHANSVLTDPENYAGYVKAFLEKWQ